ncbi:MAG: diadenylate cyclase CdaA [Anaerolineae bacterium]|nr:diadenylate cyclase CdaA [Anaerolineae bacterium]
MGLQEILWTVQNLPSNWQNLLDVLLVALVFFLVLQLVRGTRAATLLRGIAIVLVLVWTLSSILNLQAFSWLLGRTLTALAVALPVIFQEELRRWLDRVGRFFPSISGEPVRESEQVLLITEICDAVRLLARRRHGALIVLEFETGLQEYIESGVALEANVTSTLLQTIFFPNTALHDGAVIIRGERILAAACTLPVSTARRLPDRQMGLRHRAALGISEVSDAVAVIVSEESGRISVVVSGRFIRGIDADRLAMILGEYIQRTQRSIFGAWLKNLRRAA